MKHIKTLIIYALVCWLPVFGFGSNVPTSYVWISVFNAANEKPIEGVSVTIDEQFYGFTGPLGKVRIPSCEPTTLIGFYHAGFSQKEFTYRNLQKHGFKVVLDESILNIQEVVIKANRFEQNYQKVAQEVRSISAKSMQGQFQANTADALGLDPNVFIQKSQSGGGSPMIRGMSTSRVLLLVDGIRMNNAIFRSGNVHNVISVDGESISDIEISLGPGSVLHGSDALGGVMHLNTYDAHYGDSTEVLQSLVFNLSTQSGQLSRRPNFRLNYGGSNWAGMTSITYTQFNDVRMGKNILGTPEQDVRNMLFVCRPVSYGTLDTMVKAEDPYIQENTGYEQRNLTQKLKFRVGDRREIKIGQYLSLTSEINRYDRYIQTKNGMPRYARWDYGPQMWLMSYVALEDRNSTLLSDKIKITLAGQAFGESRIVRRYNETEERTQQERVAIGQLSFDASKKINQRASVAYGAEAITNHVSSVAYKYDHLAPDSTWNVQSRYADGSVWNSSSVFANLNYDITPQLSASAGSRLNAISMFTPIRMDGFEQDATFNFISPSGSVGLTYHKPTFKYFLNLSTGFRAPNVDDVSKVFDSQPGALIVPNSNLREERLYSTEFGMKHRINSWMAIDGNLYYSYLDGVMQRAPMTFNGQDSIWYEGEYSQVLAIQNIDYAQIWGYQFGLRTEFSKHVSWSLHLAQPRGKDSRGEPLRHVNPFNATSQLVYRKNKWRANLVGRYNGEIAPEDMAFSERAKEHIYAVDDQGNVYSPSWYAFNLHASYVYNKNVVLRMGIDNLMDAQYRPYSSGIAAVGRSFFVGLKGSI